MNVQLGDAAIIVKGRWPNVGKIVYVASGTTDRDYAFMGYGILPSWIVESLGGELETDAGPRQRGFTPDISLRRLELTPAQAKTMRKAKAERDVKAALKELAVVLADYIEKPAKKPDQHRERQRATMQAQKSFAFAGEA